MIKIKMCKHRLEHIRQIIACYCTNKKDLVLYKKIMTLTFVKSVPYLILAYSDFNKLGTFLKNAFDNEILVKKRGEILNAIKYLIFYERFKEAV